jgi:hypothetical protein
MATINLGRIKPVFRGAYAGGTAYVVDDIVTHGNETFICIQAGTGNATSNASYWTKLAAKGADGSDGTNVATTLTTQGDILYRDGSGLARLGYGTAGQVLQTGGSGANPSWGTVSSDFVKVNTTNISNGAGTVYLDSVFTSAYNTYKIYMTQLKGHDSTNGQIYWKFRTGSSTSTGSYWRTGNASWRTSGANNTSAEGAWGESYNNFGGWNAPDTDTESGNAVYDYEITVYGINGSNYKQMVWTKFGWEQGNTYPVYTHGGTLLNNTGTVDGFFISRLNGGGFSSDGKIIVYGLKH